MKVLELKVPPIAVMIICMVFMYFISTIFSSLSVEFILKIFLVIEVFFIGLAVGIAGIYSFTQENTTLNPMKPEDASKLVTSGIYKFSRNPMYLGLAIVLISYMIYLGNILSIFGVVLYILYMNRFQIIPEERVLEELFGDEFRNYKSKVRRWL